RWGLSEQGSAPRELDAACAVGQEAEVPDADEAARDDMEEKATDEFLGRERHDLHAGAVGVVSPAKAHEAVSVTDEPLVGDRHAVRVAREVFQDLRGPGERPFGVDDPVMLPEVRKPGRERRRLGEAREGPAEDELARG